MNEREVIAAIEAGDLDASLDYVRQALKAREGAVAREAAARYARPLADGAAPTMRLGAKVRIKSTVRPQYLAGAVGTVTDILQVNVRMVLDNPRVARRFGGEFKAPMSLVEVIG